ncbi:MAG: glycosyltransferase family 2 protein [Steroidobacteraceae bacterium]
MRLSLVVTTYERPDALAAVLATVSAQRRVPDEIIVADDGSGAATRAAIDIFAARSRVPVAQVRQEHAGFRVARLRNLAIAASRGEYVVFIDGDMWLHPDFLADHAAAAKRGTFVQGMRIPLDAEATRAALAMPPGRVGGGLPGARGLRRLYAARIPALARASLRAAGGFVATKSCNLAVWRDDLVAVNGFNEAFVGWGPEDKELVARLAHLGRRRRTLVFGGLAWHLHHPPVARDRRAVNEAILRETLASRAIRCEHGLNAHLDAHLTQPTIWL